MKTITILFCLLLLMGGSAYGQQTDPRGVEGSQIRRSGPPAEAFKACEGKTAGSAAQFVNPRGETVKGKCEEENGKLVLRPDATNKGNRQGQANDGTGGGRVER